MKGRWWCEVRGQREAFKTPQFILCNAVNSISLAVSFCSALVNPGNNTQQCPEEDVEDVGVEDSAVVVVVQVQAICLQWA